MFTPPLIFRFLTTGADALDFELAGRSFLQANELRKEWNKLEADLPVLEKILRVCRLEDESVTCSEILSKDPKRVKQFIESYPDVLQKFNIEITKEPNGYRLTAH